MRSFRPGNQRKAEKAALRRDELVEILSDIVKVTRARLPEARTADGLKAAEMLIKMCGWNEPERVSVRKVELKVDAALLKELRKGHEELMAQQKHAFGKRSGRHPPPQRAASIVNE